MDTAPQLPPPSETKPPKPIIVEIAIFLVAAAFVGPLALPILWKNPRYSRKIKVAVTVILVGVTWYFIRTSMDIFNSLMEGML